MKCSKKTVTAASMALSLLLIGSIATTAFASGTESPSSSDNTQTEQHKTQEQPEENEKSKDAIAADQVKLSEADAIQAAKKANKGYAFTVDELDSEDGIATYELKGTDSTGAQIKVYVNADDGTVTTKADHEQNEKPESNAEDTQKQSDLAAQAKITEAEAIKAAEQAESGYTFTVDELDSENGSIFYELKGSNASGDTVKVLINAEDRTVQTDAENESDD